MWRVKCRLDRTFFPSIMAEAFTRLRVIDAKGYLLGRLAA